MPRPRRSFDAATSYHVTMRCNNQAFDLRRPQARKVTPLDVLLLGDVPLPLKIDSVTSWQQAQPTPLELLAARGVRLESPPTGKGYWPLVQALLPDLYSTPDAARVDFARRGSREHLSIDTYLIDVCSREQEWKLSNARPYTCRYAMRVRLDPARRAELAQVLEIVDVSPEPPKPRRRWAKPPAVAPQEALPSPVQLVVGEAAPVSVPAPRATVGHYKPHAFPELICDAPDLPKPGEPVAVWVERIVRGPPALPDIIAARCGRRRWDARFMPRATSPPTMPL